MSKTMLLLRSMVLFATFMLIALSFSCGDDDQPDVDENEETDTISQVLVHVVPTLDSARTKILANWRLVQVGKAENLSTTSNTSLMCFDDLQYSYNFEGVMSNHNTYKLWEMPDDRILLEMNEGAYGTTDYDLIHLDDSGMKIQERDRMSSFVYYFEKTTDPCN